MFALCLLTTAASRAEAATVYAQLFPLSGQVVLRNKDLTTPFPFIYFSMTAQNNALNGVNSVWTSISDYYDAPIGSTPGNGFIDATGQWIELSATSLQLTEGSLNNPGGVLPANRAISLGKIWNPALDSSPDFSVLEPSEQPATVVVEYALEGDYFPDGTVDTMDYITWRQNFGSTVELQPDGNLNGTVDAADYVIWRDNFGMTLFGTGFSAGPLIGNSSSIFVGQVPEPTTIFLMFLSAGFLLTMRRRRQMETVASN